MVNFCKWVNTHGLEGLIPIIQSKDFKFLRLLTRQNILMLLIIINLMIKQAIIPAEGYHWNSQHVYTEFTIALDWSEYHSRVMLEYYSSSILFLEKRIT